VRQVNRRRLFKLSSRFRNVPGQGSVSGGYSRLLPYYASRGEATYPGPWDGVGHGGPSSQVPMSPRPQLNIGHGTPSPQAPIVPSPRQEFHQMYPAQLAYAPYPPQSPSFVHQQNPEHMPMFATASGSQSQSSAGVQNAVGGTYHPQWYLIFTFFL
jgi:hypothetical protein